MSGPDICKCKQKKNDTSLLHMKFIAYTWKWHTSIQLHFFWKSRCSTSVCFKRTEKFWGQCQPPPQFILTRKRRHVVLFQSICIALYSIHAKKATVISRLIFLELVTLLLTLTSDTLTASLPPVQTVYCSSSNIKETRRTEAGIRSTIEEKKLPLRRNKILIQLLTAILKGEGLKLYVYRPKISAWDFSASILGLSSIISNKLDEGILSWLTLEEI